MPDRTGIFFFGGGGVVSKSISIFLGLGVEAGASPMYPQTMRVPPLGAVGSLSHLVQFGF